MRYLLYIPLIVIFSSCNHKEVKCKTYFFDEKNSLEITQENVECKFISLETTKECLFDDIHFIEFNNDTIFLITKKHHLVLAFGLDGKFLGQIGDIGNAPGELLYPNSLYIDRNNNEIVIADMSKQSLVYYSLSDFRYKYKKNSFIFYNCCWLSDGNLAWIYHGYKGVKRNYYNVKITNSEIEEITQLYETDFSPQYLVTMGNMVYRYENNYYLNFPFESNVYKITSETVEPVFNVNFGKYKFASHEWLCRNAMEHYYGAISRTDYISACNIKETNNYINASFLCNENKLYVAFYNKKKNISCIMKSIDFVKKSGLVGVTPVKGTYNDHFISLIYPSDLKNKRNLRKDLLELSKQISEDDNPIICLFKLKN